MVFNGYSRVLIEYDYKVRRWHDVCLWLENATHSLQDYRVFIYQQEALSKTSQLYNLHSPSFQTPDRNNISPLQSSKGYYNYMYK